MEVVSSGTLVFPGHMVSSKAKGTCVTSFVQLKSCLS